MLGKEKNKLISLGDVMDKISPKGELLKSTEDGAKVVMLEKMLDFIKPMIPSIARDLRKELLGQGEEINNGKEHIFIIRMNKKIDKPIFMVIENDGIIEFDYDENAIRNVTVAEDFFKEMISKILR